MTLESPMFTSRRRFFAIAGSAGAALATVTPRAALAAPTGALDSSKIGPAFRAAVEALTASSDALEAAKARYVALDAKAAEWRDANPEPAGRRQRKRWARKWDEMRHDTGVYESWEVQLEAEGRFREAQMVVAKISPADMNELTHMAAVGAIYDKTYLSGLGNKALISYGVSLALMRLQCA